MKKALAVVGGIVLGMLCVVIVRANGTMTSDQAIVHSFMKRYDDIWIDTKSYLDYANMTGGRARRYPDYPIASEMNFPPTESHNTVVFPPLLGMNPLWSLAHMMVAAASWRTLLRHWTCFACSRARLSAGSRIAISTAMMPMTTSSSTSVNPAAARAAVRAHLPASRCG